ncbi:hypothetical protein [uncultured Paenibacillus sp.]|uniref:hypothetical protein n=1 Tax=uncultured Paenibacillus sp. TaxID=227322 RepID=UPI0015A819FC|nr:hypothetical protein [uncultured Paenibacillus sp.]
MIAIKQSGQQPIMKWIYAGPYESDVSGLYRTNYSVPVEPYLPLIAEAEHRRALRLPTEGETLELFGQSKRWAYKRSDPAEKKLTWARFGVHARCLVTFACNEIQMKRSGVYRFRLWAAGGLSVWINGKEVFQIRRLGRVEGAYSFEAELGQGANLCQVMLYNVHLHCLNSFVLRLEEDVEFQIGLPLLLQNDARERVENDLGKFYLERHLLPGEIPLTLNLQEPLASREGWKLSIFTRQGEQDGDPPLWEGAPNIDKNAQAIRLCGQGEWSEPGEYVLCIDFVCEDGGVIEGVRLPFRRITMMEGLPAADDEQRKRFLRKRYADLPLANLSDRESVYAAFVRLTDRGDGALDLPAIERTIRYINARYDCADFALHGLLRMYYRYRESELLPKRLKEAMKQCILRFKYWEDEPGPSMMFTRSENHEILFHSAEYLAGLLFPDEIFPNSGQNGLFHIQKGKAMAERWVKEKGTYGFMEWHSNTYYEEDLLALLGLVDFAEENSYIRLLAKQLIDFIVFLIATHSYKGVMGTTHGRCYEDAVIYPELESMSHINWLLFGVPERLRGDKLSIGAVALMDSSYAPPPAVVRLARSEQEMDTLTRMGLFPHDGLGGVNCATYRTKDYMVSGLVESMTGRTGHQVQAGQVLLDGNIPIFVTCFDNKSETTRPSYWGGQYRMPKTIAHQNMLAYIYKIEETAGFTHCYFPMDQFDEVTETGKWIFGRKYNAYVAVYSMKPYVKTASGKDKNRELLCLDKRNIWIIEAGNRERFGSFSGFITAISEAELICRHEELFYHSPSIGKVRLGWEGACLIGDPPVPQSDFPLVRNRFAEGEYGSGIIRLRLDEQTKILNFKI